MACWHWFFYLHLSTFATYNVEPIWVIHHPLSLRLQFLQKQVSVVVELSRVLYIIRWCSVAEVDRFAALHRRTSAAKVKLEPQRPGDGYQQSLQGSFGEDISDCGTHQQGDSSHPLCLYLPPELAVVCWSQLRDQLQPSASVESGSRFKLCISDLILNFSPHQNLPTPYKATAYVCRNSYVPISN